LGYSFTTSSAITSGADCPYTKHNAVSTHKEETGGTAREFSQTARNAAVSIKV
jgi:hypothetical protein